MRIISFIDQPGVIKKILQHIGLWEESHAPPGRDPPIKEITVDFLLQFDKLTVPSKIEGQRVNFKSCCTLQADLKLT